MQFGKQLEDKVAVITGGGGSIGEAVSRLFLEHGAYLMLADADPERLNATAERLQSDRVCTSVVDVRSSAQVGKMVQRTVERYGALDVVLSNAGNMGPICALSEYPEDGFDDVLAVHVRGAFLCCKHALPHMRPGGSIIITSSVAGVRGDPGPYGYITAKHAQVGLMRAVAKEAAKLQVRVNTLHPGPVENEFQRSVESLITPVLQQDAGQYFDNIIPLGRHAEPGEIANAALFLASAQSSFVTASVMMVDGGMSG